MGAGSQEGGKKQNNLELACWNHPNLSPHTAQFNSILKSWFDIQYCKWNHLNIQKSEAWFHDQMIHLVDFKHIYSKKVLMEDRNEGHFKSPHTKRGEVQPATNHATSCDSWQVLAAYPNPQWQRQWLQNLALLYRKVAMHQHAVFDRWLRRFAQRCSCRACCAGGRLVCGGDNVETMMCTIWVCSRA